jgi:hypothetical protein
MQLFKSETGIPLPDGVPGSGERINQEAKMALGTCEGCRHTYVVDDEVLPERRCPCCHHPLRMTSCQEVAARLRQANPPAQQVGSVHGQECVIDLHWQQAADGQWQAALVNRATGERREVSSAPALRAALEGFVAGDSGRSLPLDLRLGVSQ